MRVTKEYAGAKASMMPFLKQWTSLPALSYFLVNALDIKERTFRLKAAWAFRPPPRVTLTDQKRETWLRDLATESVPLRRLSRTIPHGIRNRALLEQCLAKEIPVHRAVWFAKCVGANELRGLKRKQSVGSELKWVHDWTEEVIHFLEQIFSKFVSESTSPNLNYACTIAMQLFQEDLLDTRLFLDWCVNYFANCPPTAIPVALILLRMLHASLFKTKLTSKLALSLVSRYDTLRKLSISFNSRPPVTTTNDNKPLMTSTITNTTDEESSLSDRQRAVENLMEKISDLTLNLLIECPDAFIQPQNWTILRSTLAIMTQKHPNHERAVSLVASRNEPLVIKSLGAREIMLKVEEKTIAMHPSWLAIWQFLDELAKEPPYNYSVICQTLLQMEEDPEIFVKAILSWATSAERDAKAYFFICVGLCQYGKATYNWKMGPIFLSFLVGISQPEQYCMRHIYDLIEEFTRLDFVSPDQYLRKVISSGIVFGRSDQVGVSAQVSILKNLPFLSRDASHQRDMLLRGIRSQAVDKIDCNIDDLCHKIFHIEEFDVQHPSHLNADTMQKLANLDKGSKVALSDALIEVFYDYLDDNEPTAGLVAYLEQIFMRLGCYRAFFHVVWLSIPRIQSSIELYFLGVALTPYAQALCAFNKLDELLELLIGRFRLLQPNNENLHWLAEIVEDIIPVVQSDSLKALLLKFVPNSVDINGLTPISDSHENQSGSNIVEEKLQEFMEQLKIEPTQLDHSLDAILALMRGSSQEDTQENIQRVRLCAQSLRHLKVINEPGMLTDTLFVKIKSFMHKEEPPTLAILVSFCVAYGCIAVSKTRELCAESPTLSTLLVNPYASQHIGVDEAKSIGFYSEFLHQGATKAQRDIYLKGLCNLIATGQGVTKLGERIIESIETREFLREVNSLDPENIRKSLVEPVMEKPSTETLQPLCNLFCCVLGLSVQDQRLEQHTKWLAQKYCDENKTLCQLDFSIFLELNVLSESDSFTAKHILESFASLLDCFPTTKEYLEFVRGMVCAASDTTKRELLLEAENQFFTQEGCDADMLAEIVDGCASVCCNDVELPSSWVHFGQVIDQLESKGSNKMEVDGDDSTAHVRTIPTEAFESTIRFLVKMVMVHSRAETYGSNKQKILAQLVRLVSICINKGWQEMVCLTCDALNVTFSTIYRLPGMYSDIVPRPPSRRTHELASISKHLVLYDKFNGRYTRYKMRPFDLLQEANPGMGVNDVPIDLKLFDCSLEKKRSHGENP